MTRPSADQLARFGRRLRAAMVLAEKSVDELVAEVGAELNIGKTTLQRTMSGRRAPRPWEIGRLAAALDVPEWFLRDGFEGASSRPGAGAADGELHRKVDEILEKIDALEEDRQAEPGRRQGDARAPGA